MKTKLTHITAGAAAALFAVVGFAPMTAEAGHPVAYTSHGANLHAWSIASGHGNTIRDFTDRLETVHRYDLQRSQRWTPRGIDAVVYNAVIDLEKTARAYRDATRCRDGREVVRLADLVACSYATLAELTRRTHVSRSFDDLVCGMADTVSCIRGGDYLAAVSAPVYRSAPVTVIRPVATHVPTYVGHSPVHSPAHGHSRVVRHPSGGNIVISAPPTSRPSSTCRVSGYR